MASGHAVNAGADSSTPKVAKRPGAGKRMVQAGGARYFLVASREGRLELGEEKMSEQEALVAAFKTDATFAVVTEWRAKAEAARGGPVIRKEAAVQKRS